MCQYCVLIDCDNLLQCRMRCLPVVLGVILILNSKTVSTQTPDSCTSLCLVDTCEQTTAVPFIYVVVALCDNAHQGIVPVAPSLGNGDDPARNLYWGASYGVFAFFEQQEAWSDVCTEQVDSVILERVVFKHRATGTYLVADAYRGKEIQKAVERFLLCCAGTHREDVFLASGDSVTLNLSQAQCIVYVGHNGLMDFALRFYPLADSFLPQKDAIILACASKQYFADVLKYTRAFPLLWTVGLCAPEAYTLRAALEAWLNEESPLEIRECAVAAYSKYQKCSKNAAKKIFVTGW